MRGHREYEDALGQIKNKGNLNELIEYKINSGDTIPSGHIRKYPKNAMYTLKDIQNKLIFECGNFIESTLIKKNKTYISNIEHVSYLYVTFMKM